MFVSTYQEMESITMDCVNCSKHVTEANLNTRYMGISGVFECAKCGAVQGKCYKGESYKIVKASMAQDTDASFDNAFYYDIEVLGSRGIERRHGWADKTTRLIIQVG